MLQSSGSNFIQGSALISLFQSHPDEKSENFRSFSPLFNKDTLPEVRSPALSRELAAASSPLSSPHPDLGLPGQLQKDSL